MQGVSGVQRRTEAVRCGLASTDKGSNLDEGQAPPGSLRWLALSASVPRGQRWSPFEWQGMTPRMHLDWPLPPLPHVQGVVGEVP